MARDDRLDVLVYGATGFTGRQLVRRLAARCARGTWGVAGRRKAALEQSPGRPPGTPVLVAELEDGAALRDVTRQTRVVLNLAGPYEPHADALIGACIATGTHYADLSGEIPFTRRLIDRHHDDAIAAGVTVVPQCGYESVPFDLLTAHLHRELRALDGSRLQEVDIEASFTYAIHPMRVGPGVSGGTLATTLAFARDLGPGRLVDPFALVDAAGDRAANAIDLRARRDPDTGDWLAPLAPAPFVNPAVVHRTAGLLGPDGYARSFRYREAFNASRGLTRVPGAPRVVARSFARLVSSIVALSEGRGRRVDRLRLDLIRRLGPRPGAGPREDRLDAIGYRLEARARSDSGRTLIAVLRASGNPGYRSSPNILAEAGLALATREAPRGVVTPAVAFGPSFLGELQEAGIAVGG